jgi:hypothetical protein
MYQEKYGNPAFFLKKKKGSKTFGAESKKRSEMAVHQYLSGAGKCSSLANTYSSTLGQTPNTANINH